ncbi:MAG: 2-C-methyl-D-erythritol 4-phosphate cytidylyltransferase [Ruminococcus sp.]|nr:2-C-methyl-D-erythritol 4-phosphate cytidylyltransferase [Ruminococcus sp.]
MNIAVIFAGGVGSRMHSKERPKQFLLMHGDPIIIHTLRKFEEHKDIDAIVVSCIESWIPYLEKTAMRCGINKLKKIVPGGSSGQESIYNGLLAAEEVANGERSVVLIHDGVRPLISEELISDNINCVHENGSAITCVPVKETIVSLNQDGKSVDYIPTRDDLRIARAPQSFWLDDILELHRKSLDENKLDFIDSCSMMKYYGKELYLVDGPLENIKITTPDDFYTMRALLDAKENAQIYGLE